MTDNEDLKRFLEQEEELRKIVAVDGDRIVINVVFPYEILLNRCNTPEKILSWAMLLSEKTWMTTPVLNRFMTVALATHGLKQVQT